MLEAGALAGVYTNLLISHGQVNRVIDDPRIKGVALTGSVEAGKIVATVEATGERALAFAVGDRRWRPLARSHL